MSAIDPGDTPPTRDKCPFSQSTFVDNPGMFSAYDIMLRDYPVFFDPTMNFYVVSRYADIRKVLLDQENFKSGDKFESARKSANSVARAERIADKFRTEGWSMKPNVGNLDAPRHGEIRSLFNDAFRPARIKEMDENIKRLSEFYIDKAPTGYFDFVKAYSVPFPISVICEQVGAAHEDVWRIKEWTDALISRVSFTLTEAEEMIAVDKIIAAQHYFSDVIHRLRGKNDNTVLGDLVNGKLSDGSCMSDEEVMANILQAIFFAGSETTTNAISAGVRLLCENPEVFERLKHGDEGRLKTFIEEVLRMEAPAQGVYRVARNDVSIGGVAINAGSVLHLRLGAANRDTDRFGRPAALDLERKNSGAHLSFGSGVHHCVGAPLARREMNWTFRTLLDRYSKVELLPAQQIEYLRNYTFRSIRRLDVRLVA